MFLLKKNLCQWIIRGMFSLFGLIALKNLIDENE